MKQAIFLLVEKNNEKNQKTDMLENIKRSIDLIETNSNTSKKPMKTPIKKVENIYYFHETD